jgi:23S rRNA (adenine2503-C2)-methyltransferase
MDFKHLGETLIKYNEPKFRVQQIARAFWKEFALSWDEITALPKELREKLKKEIRWSSVNLEKIVNDGNGAEKAVFILNSPTEKIESVLIKHDDDRRTVCVSSQIGCPAKCAFCATGQMGFKRNLSDEEIVDQVLFWARILKTRGEKITNVVFMGMGEPFLNSDNVFRAIKKITAPEDFGLGARHISISTCGITPGIKRLSIDYPQINLALSLHAPNDRLRAKLMPINKKYNIKSVINALRDHIKKTNRKVMIEYLLINEVNDDPKLALELAELLKAEPLFHLNLIPCNKTGKFEPSPATKINLFSLNLRKNNIKFTIRKRFGSNIKAACGQLAARSETQVL